MQHKLFHQVSHVSHCNHAAKHSVPYIDAYIGPMMSTYIWNALDSLWLIRLEKECSLGLLSPAQSINNTADKTLVYSTEPSCTSHANYRTRSTVVTNQLMRASGIGSANSTIKAK